MSMKQMKSLVSTMIHNVNDDLSEHSLFQKIQEKIGVKPAYVCFAIVGFISVMSILDIAGDVLTTLFGMIYPAYRSFKAIEKQDDEQKNIWLTYWIVFGLLTSVDDTFYFILDYIPGFYALRFILYVWMFYPRANNGAVIIYSFIKPYLHQWKQRLQVIEQKMQ